MRVEKEYSENMTRHDIFCEREMYDLAMRLHLLSDHFKILDNDELSFKLEKLSVELGDLRISFFKSFD